MLCNLGCSETVASPHEQCALLHTPGHMAVSPLQEGVESVCPEAGGGAELLAAVPSLSTAAATGQEIVQGVAMSPKHHPGQLARGGSGGEEHLRGVLRKAPSYKKG